MSHWRYAPGRAALRHSHREQEEAYVVVAGSGRVRLDDEVREVRRWDVVRVAPRWCALRGRARRPRADRGGRPEAGGRRRRPSDAPWPDAGDEPRRSRLRRRVADRLDVVAVGVEHVGAVVVRVVDLAHARPAVVGGARRERRGVERVDRLTARDGERDVERARRRARAWRSRRTACVSRSPPIPGAGSISSERPSGTSARRRRPCSARSR